MRERALCEEDRVERGADDRGGGDACVPYALGEPETGREKVGDYYSTMGDMAQVVVDNVRTTPEAVRTAVREFADLGADELIFNPATDEIDDVERLAEIVL